MLIEWILSDEVARGNAVADGEVAERGPPPLEGVCQAPPQASLRRSGEQAPAPTAAASSDAHKGAGSPELQRVVHERQEQRLLMDLEGTQEESEGRHSQSLRHLFGGASLTLVG